MTSRVVGMVVGVTLLASCGRFGFHSSSGDAGQSSDDAGGDGPDAAPDRPNVAFITSTSFAGDFGGIAAADSICKAEAMNQGLQGTFIAFVSTTTTNAIERLSGSRGWLRTDGEPLIDNPSDLITNGHMLNILNTSVTGARLPLSAVTVWTGTDATGRYDTNFGNCLDWTTQADMSSIGFFDRTAPFGVRTAQSSCSTNSHLYCFETGHVAKVSPHVIAGNIAFVSRPTSVSLASFDAKCQSDATAATLPGTYLAGVATQTVTIQSRFVTSVGAYRRPDGTKISDDATSTFDGSSFRSPINQYADGTYISGMFTLDVVTGTDNPSAVGSMASTCNDYMSTAGTATVGTAIDARSSEAWGGGTASCSSNVNVYCFQQ